MFLWQLQVMLRAVWEVVVQGVWLLVQVISLILWAVELFLKSRSGPKK